MRNQLRELMGQFEQMKKSYEERIASLEKKLNELEASRPADPVSIPGMKGSSTLLPDISVIGNIVGAFGEDEENKFLLDEVELAFQGYLYPNLKADVFAALHRHEDGAYEAELEEGYMTFLGSSISAQLGERFLGIGKLNAVHPHHWDFADRPRVLSRYLGDHGLAGNGLNVSWLLPTPAFLQWDVGVWRVDGHVHEHGAGEPEEFSPVGETFSSRVWTSFGASSSQEWELGVSALKSSGSHHDHHRDRVRLFGLDLTHRYFGEGYRRVVWTTEAFHLLRDVPPGTLHRWGAYSSLNGRWNKCWDAGVRYDWVQSPFPDGEEEQKVSLALTRALTETTRLRLQAGHDLKDSFTIYLQAVFGMGPHSHPLE